MSVSKSDNKTPILKSEKSLTEKFVHTDRTVLLLWCVTFFLVAFGEVMVLSASSVSSYANEHGAFDGGMKHLWWVLFGCGAMLISSRMSIKILRGAALPFFCAALLLQGAVFTQLGVEVWGNRNWIRLGNLTLQPSEILKLAMILCLGLLISRLLKRKPSFLKEFSGPAIIAILTIGLILGGSDLGTVIIVALILLGMFLFTGFSGRVISFFCVVGVSLFAFMIAISPNRLDRITSFLGKQDDYSGLDWQPLHGIWALASGGLSGVGPGESKAKWLWLPSAENDYIFAIIGEEFGLFGAVSVILCFVILFFLMIRVMSKTSDLFKRGVVAGIMSWIICQALVNIAVVLRLAPVLGVPLPLMSAGGSSLVACMAAIGIVIAIARDNEKENFTSKGLLND